MVGNPDKFGRRQEATLLLGSHTYKYLRVVVAKYNKLGSKASLPSEWNFIQSDKSLPRECIRLQRRHHVHVINLHANEYNTCPLESLALRLPIMAHTFYKVCGVQCDSARTTNTR